MDQLALFGDSPTPITPPADTLPQDTQNDLDHLIYVDTKKKKIGDCTADDIDYFVAQLRQYAFEVNRTRRIYKDLAARMRRAGVTTASQLDFSFLASR